MQSAVSVVVANSNSKCWNVTYFRIYTAAVSKNGVQELLLDDITGDNIPGKKTYKLLCDPFGTLVTIGVYYYIGCLQAILELTRSGWVFEVAIYRFSNPNNWDHDRECCDFWCSNKCDHILSFCLRDKAGTGCPRGVIETGELTVSTKTFSPGSGQSFAGVTNPLCFTGDEWTVSRSFSVIISCRLHVLICIEIPLSMHNNIIYAIHVLRILRVLRVSRIMDSTRIYCMLHIMGVAS